MVHWKKVVTYGLPRCHHMATNNSYQISHWKERLFELAWF